MRKEYKRVSEINAQLRAYADTIEKEKRSLNDEEKKDIAALENEKDLILLRSRALELPDEAPKKTVKDAVRSICDAGNRVEIRVRAEGAEGTSPAAQLMLTGDAEKGSLLPLTIGDVVKPLREELIYDKVGIQIPTGCRGNYEWPVVEAVEATLAGEGIEVEATKIDLDKVAATTQRLAVGTHATREALFQSDGKLEGIIRELLPLAISEKINQIICSRTKVTANAAISGPFVGLAEIATAFDFKGLNKAKAALLAKGLKSQRMCWVMTEATKAELEATPKDAGSGIMVIEDDKLCGLPVFTSSHIGDDYIGLGDFTYQVCGQFGDIYFVVDPYTGAGSNSVKFWLNTNFGTATLKKEAFALLKRKA